MLGRPARIGKLDTSPPNAEDAGIIRRKTGLA
jgi:hypothetical protein